MNINLLSGESSLEEQDVEGGYEMSTAGEQLSSSKSCEELPEVVTRSG